MSTASSVLAARIASTLAGVSVAAQAGVAAGTWASTSAPRIFRGIGAMSHGKNRGRCPFIEFDIIGQTWDKTAPEGGTLAQRVRLRAHVASRDLGVASEKLAAILAAALAAIRSESVDNLTAFGGDNVAETTAGPWGLMRDAEMDVEVSYSATDYEVI
jgi:hypothetical protein